MLRSKSRGSRSGSIEFGQRSHSSSIFNRAISASKFCRGDALTSQIDSNALVSKTKHLSQQQMGQVQEELRKMNEELKAKDAIIESLKLELERARGLEAKLAERDVSLGRLREELSNAKLREGHARDLVVDHQRRIHELDDEVENRRLCESKVFDLLESQTKKYEENKIELEEYKLEIASLHKERELLEAKSKKKTTNLDNGSCNAEEFQHNNAQLKPANDSEASLELKNELKMATEAEEKTRKAMDDLALALKEVATEASEAKKKHSITELELNHVKEEIEKWKEMLKSKEERYEKLLDEAKKETELHKNTIDRLRLEAEESLLAWNGREMGFVGCIKKVEEESVRLTQSLKEAQNSTMAAREETKQARDILKQAINEANAAKAAADIAREENSQLKDSLAEMEEALQFLSRLRINEAVANDQKADQPPLKQTLLSTSSLPSNNHKIHDNKKQRRGVKSPNSDSDDKSESEECVEDEEAKKAAKAAPSDGEDLDHQIIDEADIDKQTNRRRRALFRKVGDLIMRRPSFSFRKDPSPEPVALVDSSALKA